MVWQFGKFHFRAPQPWHPFFRSLDLPTVLSMLNITLQCELPDDYSSRLASLERTPSFPSKPPQTEEKKEPNEGDEDGKQTDEPPEKPRAS